MAVYVDSATRFVDLAVERERDSIALAKERKRLVFRIGQAGA